jgi:glutaredoxin
MKRPSFVGILICLAYACGNPTPEALKKAEASGSPLVARAQDGEAVTPPFEVSGDAEGLLLVWYDERGDARPASRRSEIPDAQRKSVRVDALELAPEQRLDAAYVYVADLREPTKTGAYAVRKLPREAFEVSLASAVAEPGSRAQEQASTAQPAVAGTSSDVIIYGASWCGACKQAAAFFEQKGVPFVEKDIEKEPGARTEMMTKARSQGVRTGGIPVIDVRGTLLGGFNAQRIEQLLATR